MPAMTPEQAAAYKRLRTIPEEFNSGLRSGDLLTRLFAEQLKQKTRLNDDMRAAVEPVHQALREAFGAMPGVVAAFKNWRRPNRPVLSKASPTKGAKEPRVRLGSITVVDVPPFQGLTGQSGTGDNEIIPQVDGDAGTMSLVLSPGTDDSGNAQCWCALGQAFVTPGDGILEFAASPSLSWSCAWGSTWWRQAAGTIWVGQVVNRWQVDGPCLDTPVSSQRDLYSYNDYNFADSGQKSGETSGFALESTFICDAEQYLECWVVIGAFSNADGTNFQSWAFNTAQAQLNSLTINYWE
jgi:hypothetical protein